MPVKPVWIMALLLMLGLLTAGCGAVATPRPPAPPTPQPFTLAPRPTQAGAAMVSERPTEVPSTVTPTEVPPTATPTALPPTATATPTAPPTAMPTVAVTNGDPARGAALFDQGKDAAPACRTCHHVDQDTVLVGPSLQGIASRAGERVAGQDAEEYLRLSILEPNNFLVPNTAVNVFAAGDMSLMFQQYADYLTAEDINDLVAYMLTLE